MHDKIDDLLALAADMESFYPAGDSLTELVELHADSELTEEDLSFVAAAAAPSLGYEAFRKRFLLDEK